MYIDFLQAKALAEIILDTNVKESITQRKIDSASTICTRARCFIKEGFLEKIVFSMLQKKLNFIVNAKTINEINEIEKISEPYYNGNELVPNGPYHIEEEELLMFSLTSLKAPLTSKAYERYLKIFKKLLPEWADQIEVKNESN